MDLDTILQLAVSLGLGLLVGFQREYTAPHVAGLRTFALITLFGTLSGMLARTWGGWIVGAGIVAVAAVLVAGSLRRRLPGESEAGLTTQSAALVMYVVGVALAADLATAAVIVGGSVAVLLHWKEPLHAFVERVGEAEVTAVIQLVLIALVILPVLPNQTFGPYNVLNPYHIWLMVVLICGISVGGYIAYRLLGERVGTLLSGVLGGLISSTATTVSYSRRTRDMPGSAGLAASIIMIASTIVFARVVVEIAVVAPKILRDILPPLAAMMALMTAVAAGLYFFRTDGDDEQLPLGDNPSELKAAIVFGLLYAVVIFAVAAAKAEFGDRGLFVVAALSGLTDMDAITLSTAQLIKADRIAIDTGWRMILVGALSNLVFKGAAVALLGHRRLTERILIVFGISLAGGALMLFYWPTIG